MRKSLGILFLIIGLVIIGFGIRGQILSANLDAKNRSNAETADPALRQFYYESDKTGQKQGFYMVMTVAVILSIIGIIMIRSAKRKAAENLELKKILTANASSQSIHANHITTNDDKLSQLEKLGKLKEQGLITEEEFQQQKKKFLE